jgi:putative transposase
LSALWLRHWEQVIPIFDYPDDIRRAIYTTNAIESLNSVIRKAINNRRIFPSDRSAFKVIYLLLSKPPKNGPMPIKDWETGPQSLRHSIRGPLATLTQLTKTAFTQKI